LTQEFLQQNVYHSLDIENPLGSGAYGSVYKAKLTLPDGRDTNVAVKTINPLQNDVTCLKNFFQNLK